MDFEKKTSNFKRFFTPKLLRAWKALTLLETNDITRIDHFPDFPSCTTLRECLPLWYQQNQTMNTWMTPRRGFKPPWCQISATLFVPLSKALYSNCSVVRRSHKAVSLVYMYLNINTSVHVKKHHRLFEKSRGSSRYCWLLVCTQCRNT